MKKVKLICDFNVSDDSKFTSQQKKIIKGGDDDAFINNSGSVTTLNFGG